MKKTKCTMFLLCLALLLLPCGAFAQSASINLNSYNQTIQGFGGMNFPRWIADLTTEQIDTAFGTGAGKLGFSIVRVNISPYRDQWGLEVPTAQKVKSYGGIILASPWSPPASMKTNNSTIRGELKTDSYGAYAQYLADFADYMSANDAEVYAISLQNEPDWLPDYESCGWSADQIRIFLANNASIIPAKVLMPETVNFKKSFFDTILTDSMAAAEVDIVGYHLYGGSPVYYPLAEQLGKDVWMTEHYTSSNISANTWPDALGVGEEVHNCMINNMNAYIWWYIRRSYGMIDDSGNVTKRGYVMSHFSRFVRPGFIRIDATPSPIGNLFVSAYTDGDKLVIVAVNRNADNSSLSFNLSNGQVSSFTKYETTSSSNVSNVGSIAAGSSFTNTLKGNSIATYVGTIGGSGENIPPTADAGADIVTTDTDESGSELVTLDGSDSSDPDGSIVSYIWRDQDGNQIATGPTPEIELEVGTHSITLTVTDNESATASDDLLVTVHPGNDSDCTSETSVSLPFSQDGEGNFCFVTTGSVNYANSWCMDYVEINGKDFTNTWASGSEIPSSGDGKIHIRYEGAYPWSHFEIK